MEKNFKLTIEYDGTNYHGWQKQKKDKTIQEEIEKALFRITGQKITLIGSGRTDSGVHALGQVANFKARTHLTATIFMKALNSILKSDIIIKNCKEAPLSFHARFDVKSKTYHYFILNKKLPRAIGRMYHWHIPYPLDIKAMNIAASYLVGEHDFAAFEGAGSPRAHTVRRIFQAQFVKNNDGMLIFKTEANGFLRFMVRNIVGTLKDVGSGKITPEKFREILLSENRKNAGATAPPHGLFLVRVCY